MPVINKSPFPKTDKMGRKVPDGEAKFIDKHETETIVRDEKTGTASDDTFQAKNIPVTNYKRQSAMTYEQAALEKVMRIHKNIAFDSKVNEYLQISEEKMTEKQKAKREEIVMSMKDKEGAFKKKYGKRAKEVMYATATKMAMEGYIAEGPTSAGMSPGQSIPRVSGGVIQRPTLPPLGGTPTASASGGRDDRGGTTPAPQQPSATPRPAPSYKGSAGAQDIQKANPSIKNVNQIRAGQVIKVGGQNYTVKPGDTLDKIARNNPTRQAGPTTADLNRKEAARVTTQNQAATSASPSQSAGGSSVPRSNPSPYAPRSRMNNDQSNAPIGKPSTFPTPPTNPGQGNANMPVNGPNAPFFKIEKAANDARDAARKAGKSQPEIDSAGRNAHTDTANRTFNR